jgi:hypothetical protein
MGGPNRRAARFHHENTVFDAGKTRFYAGFLRIRVIVVF